MWKKNFRTRKVQTAMMFLVIMLCSTLLTGAISILISLEKPFKELSQECDAAAAIFFSYEKNNEDIMKVGEEFAALKEVKQVEALNFYSLDEEITVDGKKIEAFIRLTEYKDSVFSKIRYVEGSKNVAATLKDRECIIPACISNDYDLHIGDEFKVAYSSGDKSYLVKGIYASPYSASNAFASDILVNDVEQMKNTRIMMCLYGKENVTGSDIEAAYREQYNGQLNGYMMTVEQMIDNSLITGHIIGAIFLAIGIIMLFVSVLIIQFMIRNAMIMDAKDIAVYKVTGYTSGDILKIYMMFYFVIVLAASFTGTLASTFLSDRVLTSIYEDIGRLNSGNVLLPGALCITMTVSFVLMVIWRIIKKNQNVKPVVVLTGNEENGIKKKKKYKGNSKVQFSSFGIALRSITRSKKSMIGILVTCMTTIFGINFAIISLDVANTQKNNNDFWLGIDKSDVVISLSDPTQFDTVFDIVDSEERVSYLIYSSRDNRISLDWHKGMQTTTMNAFVYEDYSNTKLPLVEGRNPNHPNEIALASKMSDQLDKKLGDYIEVYLDGSKKVNLLITGIYQTYYELGEACRLTTATYEENDYELNYNNISVYLKKGEEKATFIEDMKKKIGTSGEVMLRTEQYKSIMDMIVIPQQKAIPPVTILVLLLGAVNIFCIVMLKNANNKKSNGIYKCIGYSTSHLIRSNMIYVGIIAGASMLIALPAILITYPNIMKLCLATFGFLEYPVNYQWSHIVIANIGIILLFVISTLVSSHSLHKVNARDLVQE